MLCQYLRRAALAVAAVLSCTSMVQAQTAVAGTFRTPPGFEVDMVYEVPFKEQGSWVCLCIDPKGRIIASDQYGKLYRVTLSGDPKAKAEKVEQLQIDIGMAQGMYAFDNVLLININGNGPTGPGVYRLTDTDANDQYDKIEHVIPIKGTGEHGPHAIIPGPDGKIYFCGGNQSDVPEKATKSVVPRHWSEDHIVGRMPDARGFMKDRLAPGGWICRMDRDCTNVELMATGFRNEYDIAFNPQGDLFTYDADMEWDIGTPGIVPRVSTMPSVALSSVGATGQANGLTTIQIALGLWQTSARAHPQVLPLARHQVSCQVSTVAADLRLELRHHLRSFDEGRWRIVHWHIGSDGLGLADGCHGSSSA